MNTFKITRKALWAVLAAMLMSVSAIGQDYTVTVSSIDDALGTVSGGGTYASGSSATITATPAAGYAFEGWYENGNLRSTTATYTFRVRANRNFVAHFGLPPATYTVSTGVMPNANAGTASGGRSGVLYEENVTVSAEATNPSYVFAGWYSSPNVDINLTSPVFSNEDYTITVRSDTTVYAYFRYIPQERTVSVAANPAATGTVSVNGGATATLYEGETMTLAATPNSGYSFLYWTLNGETVSTDANCTVTLPNELGGDPTYVANFVDRSQVYTIVANSNIANAGNVTVSPSNNINGGDPATVTATPAQNYVFEGWTEDGQTIITTDNPYTFTVVGPRTLTAMFHYVAPTYTVTATASPAGAGTFSGTNGFNGTGTYNENTTVTVIANASNDYAFQRWTENGNQIGTSASYTITSLTSNRNLVAEFIARYTITAVAGNGGTVTGSGAYNSGATATLTATANNNYEFQNWTENGVEVSTSATYSFTVTGARTVTANFLPKYAVSVSANPTAGGSVTGAGSFTAGTSPVVVATANNGYNFVNWTEGGNIVAATSSYTIANIDQPHTLVANFELKRYTIGYTANPSEGGTVTGAGQVNHGATVSLTPNANSGFQFQEWRENGQTISTTVPLQFTATANRTIEAVFSAVTVQYSVNVSASPNDGGTVTRSPNGPYNAGDEVTVTATPNTGSYYEFVNWTENGVEVSTNATYVFNVNANRNLVANFVVNRPSYTINAVANPTAGGTQTGQGRYEAGQSVSLTATANPNYTFVNWTVDGVVKSTNSNYVFPASADVTCTANYNYTPAMHNVNVAANPTEGGRINGLNNTRQAYGTDLTLTAVPNTDYVFVNWTSGSTVVSTNTTYEFTVRGDVNLVANFNYSPAAYAINAVCDPANSGTISGTGSMVSGVQARLTATANPGYEFDSWIENGQTVSTENPYVFLVNGNRSLVAHFNRLPGNFTITAIVTPDEGGTVQGAGNYTEGATATLTAVPNAGYNFTGWYEGSTLVNTGLQHQFTVTANKTFYAVFQLQTVNYTINATVNPQGVADVTGTGTYTEGDPVVLQARATNANYQFLNWTENGQIVSRNARYSFIALANHDLVANFYTEQGQQYNINVTSNDDNGGTVSGGGVYTSGDVVTITATPAQNYYFVGWSENGVIINTSANLTFFANSDRTLVGVFSCYCHTQATIDDGEGTITDGSGSDNYLPGTNCRWLIHPVGAETVTLTFTEFSTVEGLDYVDIYDGTTTSAPRIGHFSGHSLPRAVTANTGVMLVLFTTNGTRSDAGWSANYTSTYGDDSYLRYSDSTKTIVVGCRPTVTSVNIPGRVMKIAANAFEGCNDMVRISIPGSIDTIDNYAFNNCSSLKSISLPASIRYLGHHAFNGCSALESVELPAYLDTIRPYTFNGCSNLKRIDIPNTVKRIGERAFYGCSRIYSLNVPGSVDTVENYAFASMSGLRFVTLNAGNKYFGYNAFYYSTWNTNIQLTNFNGTIADWLTISFNNEYANPMRYSRNFAINGQIVNDLVIPEGTDTVNGYAFYNNSQIFTITLPSTLDTIGAYAFYNLSGLERIYLNAPQSKVNEHAFDGVDNKIPVVVPCYALDDIRQNGWSIFTRFIGQGVPILTLMQRDGGIAKITTEPNCNDYTAVVSATPGNSYEFMGWSDGSTDNPHTIVMTEDDIIAPVFQRKASDNRRIYFFGFEDEIDIANWFGGNEGANKWHIGDALSQEGDSSLYITNDGGANNNYSNSSSPYIYTDVYLKDGVYDISFYWLALGEENRDYMRLGIIPDGVNVSPDANGAIMVGGRMYNQPGWDIFERTAQIPTEGWYKLAFFWNTNGSVVNNPAPAVDNIYLEYKEPGRVNRMMWPVFVEVADPNAGYATGSGNYYYNQTFTIQAFANSHYRFTHWSDGSTDNPRTIPMSEFYGNDEHFVAYFEEAPWHVTVSLDHPEGGNVIGEGYYQTGDNDTIAMVYPTAGWAFMGWIDNNSGSNQVSILDNPYYVAVDRDLDLTAVMTDLDTAFLHDTTVVVDTLYIHDTLYVIVTNPPSNSPRTVPGGGSNEPSIDPTANIQNVKIYTNNGQIVVDGAGKFVVSLYDINGRLLNRKQDDDTVLYFDVMTSGTYMIRIGEHVTRKVVVVK